MTYAAPAEIAVLLGRTFTADEIAQCQAFLNEAEGQILERIPDLLAKIDAETITAESVARVERRSVRRVMLNPEGKKTERLDDYSYGRDEVTASGEVYISDEEWSWLIPAMSSGEAFSITTANAGPYYVDIPRDRAFW